MPPSTIPSTSSAISSPGRRFGSSDQKQRRNGAARPTRHDNSPRLCILTKRLNLTVPIRELHFGIEQIEALPKVRKRRLELSLEAQHHSERHVRPDETGRIVEPFGHTHRLLGEMLRLLHFE